MERAAAALERETETLDMVTRSLSTLYTHKLMLTCISADDLDAILWRLKLDRIDVQRVRPVSTTMSLEGFPWGFNPEPTYTKEYCAILQSWMQDALAVHSLTIVRCERKQGILSADIEERGLQLTGDTDLLIIPSKTKRTWRPKEMWPRQARVVVELKKADQAFSTRFQCQTITQLLALDFKAESAVVALLTDLNDRWFFYWLSINRQVCSLKMHDLASGVATLRDILQSSSGAAQVQLQLSRCTPSTGRGQCFAVVKYVEMNGWRQRARVVLTASNSDNSSSDSSDPPSSELSTIHHGY